MTETPKPNAKVLFRVPNEDGTAEVETLWATHLGNDQYKLENSPFWAYGVSWEDIVFAPFEADEEFPIFYSVVSKSGNRTIRIAFDPPSRQETNPTKLSKGCLHWAAVTKAQIKSTWPLIFHLQ